MELNKIRGLCLRSTCGAGSHFLPGGGVQVRGPGSSGPDLFGTVRPLGCHWRRGFKVGTPGVSSTVTLRGVG